MTEEKDKTDEIPKDERETLEKNKALSEQASAEKQHSPGGIATTEKPKSQIEGIMQSADKVIDNRVAQREKTLAETEARIDEKTKVLQQLTKEAEAAGKSEVSADKSEAEQEKEKANKLLKGTGMEF